MMPSAEAVALANRELQTSCLPFNTSSRVELRPDQDGRILLPSDTLMFALHPESPWPAYVRVARANDGTLKLVHEEDGSDQFERPVLAVLVRLVPLEETPQEFRDEVAERARALELEIAEEVFPQNLNTFEPTPWDEWRTTRGYGSMR